MERVPATLPNITIADAVANSEMVNKSSKTAIRFYIPATSQLTSIAWYGAYEEDGTPFVAIRNAQDAGGTRMPIETAVAAGDTVASPPELYDVPFVTYQGTFSSGSSESIPASLCG